MNTTASPSPPPPHPTVTVAVPVATPVHVHVPVPVPAAAPAGAKAASTDVTSTSTTSSLAATTSAPTPAPAPTVATTGSTGSTSSTGSTITAAVPLPIAPPVSSTSASSSTNTSTSAPAAVGASPPSIVRGTASTAAAASSIATPVVTATATALASAAAALPSMSIPAAGTPTIDRTSTPLNGTQPLMDGTTSTTSNVSTRENEDANAAAAAAAAEVIPSDQLQDPPSTSPVAIVPIPLSISEITSDKRIYCLRHSESIWNVNGSKRVQGLIDTTLTNAGIRQAKTFGALLRRTAALQRLGIQLIVVSPLSRTLQTYLYAIRWYVDVNPSCRVVVSDLIAEQLLSTGTIGRSPDLLMKDFPDPTLDFSHLSPSWWYSPKRDDLPPRAAQYANSKIYLKREPNESLHERIALFKMWLRDRPEQNVLIVGHGTFFRHLIDQPESSIFRTNLTVWRL